MRYFIVAGEASGDIHAAELISALSNADNCSHFDFLGGDLMAAAAGHAPLIHYRDMAFMGFSEVLRHLPRVLGNLNRAKQEIRNARPDALILIDYPSFNLKLAAFAHKLGIPVYYYISPKVWAWKEHRVKDIKRYVRRMFSILPFEVNFYKTRHNYDVTYVGNPSVEEIERRASSLPSREEFIHRHNLSDRPIIALVPGSRKSEIKNNLAIMQAASARYTDHQIVVAAAPGIELEYYGYFIKPGTPIVSGVTFELMKHADAALVTSGTATLECALLGTPQVVCYRANGVKLSYQIMEKILKIPFVSLPNLIANEAIVPEMLVHKCTPQLVERELGKILPGRPGHDCQLKGYKLMRDILGQRNAAMTTANAIFNDLTTLTKHNDYQ